MIGTGARCSSRFSFNGLAKDRLGQWPDDQDEAEQLASDREYSLSFFLDVAVELVIQLTGAENV